VDTGSLSSWRDILTRKTSRYHVNKASPWSSVKCPYVRPNRENGQDLVILSLSQNGRAVGIEFHRKNRSPPEQMSGEYSATSPGEESEFS
jgi:hypothetical protein